MSVQKIIQGKYFPLQRHLRKMTCEKVSLTFDEIEEIIMNKLPYSAHHYAAWWSNSLGAHTQTAAWLNAGYRVSGVDFGRKVEFIRI